MRVRVRALLCARARARFQCPALTEIFHSCLICEAQQRNKKKFVLVKLQLSKSREVINRTCEPCGVLFVLHVLVWKVKTVFLPLKPK